MMRLYDSVISEFRQMLEPYEMSCTARDVASDGFVWESREGQVLLKSEAVAELGGGNLPAVSGVLCTCLHAGAEQGADAGASPTTSAGAPLAVSGRKVMLYGPDLPALKGDVPYARVMLVNIREEFAAEEYKLYNLFRSIEYIRYHVNPRGYMPRISTAQSREQVRVSGDAVRDGLDFFKVGRVYGDACLKHPAVESAETFFITLDGFDYRALQDLFDRAERITMSLEHSLNHLNMDCTTCNLRRVCDEAEKCLKA